MKKIFLVVIGLICIALIVLSVVVDGVVKNAITGRISDTLGMVVTIDEVDVGLFGANIDIRGFTITNTESFGSKDFVTIPNLSVDTRLSSLLGGQRKLQELKVHIADVGIVKNKDGELNVSLLKSLAARNKKPGGNSESEDGDTRGSIEKLVITFDHITFWDFSKTDNPEAVIIPVGVIHQTFRDVDSPQIVGQAVIMAAVLEGTSQEGGMDKIFALGDELKTLGGPAMAEKLDEFKTKFTAPGAGSGM